MRSSGWLLVLFLSGCSGAASRVTAPDWDPPRLATRAMEELDMNQDGLISGEELAKAPGLLAGLKVIDTDNDKSLSLAEITERFELYQKLQLGLTSRQFRVTYRGKPINNATVKLVPEPFLEGVIEPASGVTNADGVVSPSAGVDDLPGLRPGYYRIEVTSDTVQLPAKFNTTTILGAEVSPARDDPDPFRPKAILLAE